MRHHPVRGLSRRVSALSFGCGAIGGLVTRGSFEEQCAVVSAALDRGVNFFDTAPMYGQGVSERVLGQVLHEIGADPVVATKVNLLGDDFADPAAAVRRSLTASLERLGRDRVDVLYLHNRIGDTDDRRLGAVSPRSVLQRGGIADAMADLVSEGLVGTLGFCGFGHVNAALEVLESQRFSLMQVPANLLNPSASMVMSAAWRRQNFGGIAVRARELGVAAVGIRALAGGSLADTPPHPYRSELPPMVAAEFAAEVALAKPYADIGAAHGGLAHVALRYAFGLEGVSGVVLGISDLTQLQQALDAEQAGPLSDDVIETIHGLLDELFLTV